MTLRISQSRFVPGIKGQISALVAALLLSTGLTPASATPPISLPAIAPVSPVPETISGLIVYYHQGTNRANKTFGISLPSGPIVIEGGKSGSVDTSVNSQEPLSVGGFSESVKVDLPSALSESEARAYATEIQQDPDVKAVLVDRKVSRHGIFTNDPLAYILWGLEGGDAGTTHTEPVWPQGKGTGITVAVLDTGKVEHPDMLNVWTGGYDLISDTGLAADGDARDADATDMMTCDDGSGSVSADPHGLMVGSVIAARLDNAIGLAGVAPTASIVPVRVISGCGGLLSDVLDGMRWAVGLPVTGLPLNPTPVKVLNLSLGTTSPGAVCSSTVQGIVDEVRATGATIVVSTGNDGADAISVPAACQGVIAVTASTRDGKRADYGNAGAGTTLAAPGGGCAVGAASGCAAAQANYIAVGIDPLTSSGYAMTAGTSFSAPYVAGTVALLLERNPTRTPDDIRSILVNSTRAFASGDCPGDLCGTGMLDVNQALNATGFTLSASADSAAVRAADSVRLTAQASSDAINPVYTWRQLSGQAVVLDVDSDGRGANFIAPSVDQTLSFEVKVTDNSAAERIAVVSTRVSVAPELTPIGTIRVLPGVVVRAPFTLASGGEPSALGLDAAAIAKGIRVENNEVVWLEPAAGDHSVQVTPFDEIGSGIASTVNIEVQSAETDVSATNNSTGGGGALGLHGALLLMLAWIARRRLYAG